MGRFLLFTLFAALLSAACQAGEFQILTENYPPLSFEQNGQASGIMPAVAREIQRRIGDNTPIQVVPWARAYHIGMGEGEVLIFSVVRTKERETLFQWVGPVTPVVTNFYARADSDLKIASLDDARALTSIGVARDFYSDQLLTSAGFTNLDRSVSPTQMTKKLLANRIPVMVNDDITLIPLLADEHLKPADLKPLYTLIVNGNYFAFSLATPPERVMAWRNAFEDMKRDGTFAKIYQQWLPGETPPP